MEERRAHGKMNRLPENIRKKVECMLIDGYTYKEIQSFLKQAGYSMGEETIRRYGKPFLKKFESVRIAKEFTYLLSAREEENPTTDLQEANNALINQLILEAILDESIGAEDKIRAASAIATLQRAQIANEKLKIEAKKEAGAVHLAFERLKKEVFSEIGEKYPEIAKEIIRIADELEKA